MKQGVAQTGSLPPRVHSYNGRGDDSFEIILVNPNTAMEREKRRWFILPGDGLLVVDP